MKETDKKPWFHQGSRGGTLCWPIRRWPEPCCKVLRFLAGQMWDLQVLDSGNMVVRLLGRDLDTWAAQDMHFAGQHRITRIF